MSVCLKNKKVYSGLIFVLIILINAAAVFPSTVTLSWEPPTTDAAGEPLSDLAGYMIYYGTETGTYSLGLDVGNVLTYPVSGLVDGQSYYFAVTAYDTAGNESDYSNEAGNIIAQDTKPPVISSISSGNITGSAAAIKWNTDETSDSRIEYGISATSEKLIMDTALVSNHHLNLSGLSSSTTYRYRVHSHDTSGNMAVSAEYAFTTANAAPSISAFSANPLSGVAPLTVNFTASVSDTDGSIAACEWDFNGDGIYDKNTGLAAGASFTYSAAGVYNARLRVTDNKGDRTTSNPLTITVSAPAKQYPVISSFTASPASGKSPLKVYFTVNAYDPDGTIKYYKWDFDGNGTFDKTTTSNRISFNYKRSGTRTVKVQVIDNTGLGTNGYVTVTVY